MRYSGEPKHRKHVARYDYLQEDLVINMVKKVIDTAAKTVRDAGKTAFKKVVQKTVESTGI